MNLSVEFEPEEFNSVGSDTYRVFFKKKLPNAVDTESAQVYITPFHDIPLYSEVGPNIHRMIVRMPRWSNARMEISRNEPFNPIKQDGSRQVLRYYENIFPYHGVLWNYGSFPQTWEMLSYMHPDFPDLKGDNSLLDVIEIGSKIHKIGTVLDVKILGAILLIDQDHLDWKIIAIDVNDQLAPKIENLIDVENRMPGLLDSSLEFFKYYKVILGHPPIRFGYTNVFLDQNMALETIARSHKFWKNLITNEIYFKNSKDSADFKLFNTQCLESNKEYIRNSKEAEAIIENLKMLIVNRPIESMAQQPPLEHIERVIYLNKNDFLIPKTKEETSKEAEEKVEKKVQYESLGKYLKENFFIIVFPTMIFFAGAYFTSKRTTTI